MKLKSYSAIYAARHLTRLVTEMVNNGHYITITVGGREVAKLAPMSATVTIGEHCSPPDHDEPEEFEDLTEQLSFGEGQPR